MPRPSTYSRSQHISTSRSLWNLQPSYELLTACTIEDPPLPSRHGKHSKSSSYFSNTQTKHTHTNNANPMAQPHLRSDIVRKLTSGSPNPIGLASSSCGGNVLDWETPCTSKWYGIYMQCMAHCRAYIHSTSKGRALRSENVECITSSEDWEQQGLYSGGMSCCWSRAVCW